MNICAYWVRRCFPAAVCLIALAVTASPANAANTFANSSIASVAERSKDGAHGGQCMAFVRETLVTVSGGRIRTSAYTYGYQGTFKAKGGTLIKDPNAAIRGDIIQVTPAGTPDTWKGPERMPLHTAIVRQNLKGGNFAVIDSNYKFDERVLRHQFNPYSLARKYGGGVVKIWRLGAVPAKSKPKATSKPKSTAQAPPGTGDSTGFFEPGPAGWHLSNALAPGASNYIFARGESGSIPVVGDWDGDGKDSTGAYYPWDQSWHLRNSLSAGASDYIFARGQPNSTPVVGDWNGDGRDSTGVYFPWDQSWHLRNELGPGPSQYAFVRATPNSVPVVGDWDGR